MRALLLVLAALMLSGCCTLAKYCKDCKVDTSPKEPIVITKVHIVPDYLVEPCKHTESLIYGMSYEELLAIMILRESEQNDCADQVDQLRNQVEQYKKSF